MEKLNFVFCGIFSYQAAKLQMYIRRLVDDD